MKRNCNLELRLVTPSVSFHSSDYNAPYNSILDMGDGYPKEKQQQKQHELQEITIFYNGRVATCDLTELQARTIILLANREMERKTNKSPRSDPSSVPVLNSQMYGQATGLSMKRSLQRFLQKRKTRAQATFPYTSSRYNKQ